jgi:hypothetical protein
MPDPAAPTIESLTTSFRERLRWRHVLTVAVAAVMVLVALGGIVSIWVPKRPSERLGTDATRVPWTVLFGAVYIAGATLMSYGLARFDMRRAVRRLPLMLALSLVVLAVVLVFGLLEQLSSGGSSGGGNRGSTDRDATTEAEREAQKRAARAAENLACALVDAELAARVLGGPVSDSDRVPSLTRETRVCRCETSDTANQLFVWVCEGKRADKRWRRAGRVSSAIGGLGDEAMRADRRVSEHRIITIAVRRGGWLVDVTAREVEPTRPVDENALIDLARTAIGRLPA